MAEVLPGGGASHSPGAEGDIPRCREGPAAGGVELPHLPDQPGQEGDAPRLRCEFDLLPRRADACGLFNKAPPRVPALPLVRQARRPRGGEVQNDPGDRRLLGEDYPRVLLGGKGDALHPVGPARRGGLPRRRDLLRPPRGPLRPLHPRKLRQ